LGQGQGKPNQGAGVQGSAVRKETLSDFGMVQTHRQPEAFFLSIVISVLKSQFSTYKNSDLGRQGSRGWFITSALL